MMPDARRELPPSLLHQRIRALTVILAPTLVLTLLFVVPSEGTPPQPDRSPSATSSPAPSPGKSPVPRATGPFTVSYAGAVSRLADLPEGENREQLRDWLRGALAAHLGLGTARYRDAVHDAAPVRDAGLADLVRQPTGPGRALFDGRDVLHLLVPADDARRSRTLGLLLDDHRADHGSDPRSVQVHPYTIDASTKTVHIAADPPLSPAELRAKHGYVTMRVDRPGGLRAFLERTRHLSRLKQRGAGVWAEGWKWPSGSAPAITMADVAAIQRGYLQDPVQAPGFSLDPPEGRHTTPGDDLRSGRMYHQARYEGGLEGTEVGMTLFYTDLIAKLWTIGVGTGVPDKAVKGFVADPDAKIPAGHCPVKAEGLNEKGRLWFGQDDSGFRYEDDRVEIGARATRLFVATSAGDGEVESSYAFARGLRWWDRHYRQIADYEPQYARLEQIMRWSGALEWLASRPGETGLPGLDGARGRDDLRFESWYARHSKLRERQDLTFVTAPSGGPETVISKPSKRFEYCGRIAIRGGVSLADGLSRRGGQEWRPGSRLPSAADRAGLFEPSSRLDPNTGTGRITRVSLDANGQVARRVHRRFSNGKHGSSVVETAGEGRRSWSFGKLKVWRSENAPRTLRVERTARGATITESIALEGHRWGRFEAVAKKGRVVLRWFHGPLGRVRSALHSAQERSAPAHDSVLYRYGDAYKTGGADAGWLTITKEITGAGDDLAFRLGHPRPGRPPEFSLGLLSAPGRIPGSPRGPPSGWLRFDAGGRGPTVVRSGTPPNQARTMRVETPEGRGSTLRTDGTRAWVTGDDPVLGLHAAPSGAALLRDIPRVHKAWNQALAARDGFYRPVALGDEGFAFVGAGKTIIAGRGRPFAERVHEALGRTRDGSPFLIGFDSGKPFVHGRAEPVFGKLHQETRAISDLADLENVLVPERLRDTVLHKGDILPNWAGRQQQVRVRPAWFKVDRRRANPVVLADSYQLRRGQATSTWLRVTGPGGRPGRLRVGAGVVSGRPPTPTPSPAPMRTPTSSPPTAPRAGIIMVPVWLACPTEGPQDPVCAP